jgi:hypothetical protein
MIELFISSIKEINKLHIAHALLAKGVDFQIYSNICTHHGVIEKGYLLKLFNVTQTNFKEDVWDVLEKLLGITCGFVRSELYIGCTMNWCGVFRDSACLKDPRILVTTI